MAGAERDITAAPLEDKGCQYLRSSSTSGINLSNQLIHLINNEQIGEVQREDVFPLQTREASPPIRVNGVEGIRNICFSGVCTPQDSSTTSLHSSTGSQIPSSELFVENDSDSISEDVWSSNTLHVALSHVRRLQSVPVSYIELDKFLCSIECFARRFNKEDKLFEIAEGQMDGAVRYFYRKRMDMLYPGRQKNYKTLVELMLRLLCLGNPETFLRRELRGAPPHKALKLYVELGLLYDAYTRLCERTNTEIRRTEDSLAQEFVNRLPNRLAEQTRRVVRNVPSPNLFAYAVVARTVDSHLNGNW